MKGGLGLMEKSIKVKPKVLMKTIAIILTSIMILQLFPAIVFGVQRLDNSQENTSVIKENQENDVQSSTEIVGEILEKRTLNQKHFLQDDGTIISTVYPSNIHYEKDGKLVDIDNSLEEKNEDEGIYQNKNNDFKIKFAKKSNKNNLEI